MFIIDKDILQTLVQYLNQVDIANLMLTCKHYGFNPMLKDCLSKIYKFLNKKGNLCSLYKNNYIQFMNLFFKEIYTSEAKGSNEYLIWFVHKILKIADKPIFVSDYYIDQNKYYTLNIDICFLYKYIYVLDTNTLIKFIKFKDDNNNEKYMYKKTNLMLYEIPPKYFDEFNVYKLFYKNDYFDTSKLIFNVYNYKSLQEVTSIKSYIVYEFNINKCKSKIGYFIKSMYSSLDHDYNIVFKSKSNSNLFTFESLQPIRC